MAETRVLTQSQAMRLTKNELAGHLTELANSHKAVNGQLVEAMANLDLLMDNRGWRELNTITDEDDGPTLDQIKEHSRQIRNLLGLNGLVKHGFKLRVGNVWAGGIHYGNIPGAKQGRGTNVQERIDNPINQDAFFGSSARERREACLYSDSQALWVGNDDSFELEEMPLSRITGDYRNPKNAAQVWAYRRTWPEYNAKGESVEMSEWIFTNLYASKRAATPTIKLASGVVEPVNQKLRIFGYRPVNSMTGWAYGIPDALPMIAHVRMYVEFMQSGKIMSDSLAKIAYVAKVNTQAGADSAGMRLGGDRNKGGTAVLGAANDLSALSTAGKGYDFRSGQPLAAMAAAAIEVSVVALLSDSSAAGSSYGAAQTLSKPERDSTLARRQFHKDIDREVLIWLGAPDPEVWFDSLDDETAMYRRTQAVMLKWSSGLYKPEQIKKQLEEIWGRDEIGDIPSDVLIPNVASSLARKDVDTDGTASPNATTNGGGFASGQGQSSAANAGQGSSQKSDDIASKESGLKFAAQLEVFGEMLERLEVQERTGQRAS